MMDTEIHSKAPAANQINSSHLMASTCSNARQGNVVCLDVLRVLQGEPDSLKEAMRELKMCFGIDPRFDGCVRTEN